MKNRNNSSQIDMRSLIIILALITPSTLFTPLSSYAQLTNSPTSSSDNNKVVILTFGDTVKSQFTNAKPILDKYGFKASFFITCLWVGSENSRMNWNDIAVLQKDGMGIESKTMSHREMTTLSPAALNYEVAQSQRCLANHGINATAFATTHGDEAKNATIIKEIAKYYDLAINGFGSLMFLHCNGYTENTSQTDCRTYFKNGTLTLVNRYSIVEWSHNNIDTASSFNDTKIFDRFVKEVNSQDKYNKLNGPVVAIPIIGYHGIDPNKTRGSTEMNLFAQEMKYLHDNGFKVITVDDLGYDTKNNVLYIKPSSATAFNTSRPVGGITVGAPTK